MSHTFTKLLYHVVYATKGRRAMLRGEVKSRLRRYTRGVVANHEGILLELDGDATHAHLLAAVKPMIAVATFVQKVKSNTSRWVSRQFPRLREFSWQVGYSAFTVSESMRERVAAYIRNQEEHHRGQTFEEELAELLRRHGVEFDAERCLG